MSKWSRLRATVTVDDDRDYTPPVVVMVDKEDGCRAPSPPLDQKWSDLEKLRWKAALVSFETGLNIRVCVSRYWIGGVRVQGVYDVSVQGPMYASSGGGGNMDSTWTYLNGIHTGGLAAGTYDGI